MKRFAALLALALAATGVFAGPAHASGITVDMLSPGNGAVARGSISVKGYAESADGIEAMSLTVAGVGVGSMSPSGNKAELSYVWNTVNAPQTYSPIANGDYYASITATSKTGESAVAETTILVDNAPSIPKGISANGNDGSVQVSWAANPEPDISGYKLERSSGGSWTSVATVGGTSYTDNVGSGSYTYRVTAIRPSPVSGSRSSIPSSGASATVSSASSSSGDTGSTGSDPGTGGGSSGTGAPNLPGGVSNVGDLGGRNGALNASNPDRIGGKGLPSYGLSLPGISGLFGIPQLPVADTLEWGEYDDTLPYDLPNSTQVYNETLINGVAARAPDRIIPPDGLRWVAAGLLLLVGASMLRFGAVRLGGEPAPMTISALPPRSVTAPVIPLRPSAPRLVETEGDRGETTEPEENPVLTYLRARW